MTVAATALARTLDRIEELEPRYARKLAVDIAKMDGAFHARAEAFLSAFERFMASKGKSPADGVDYHLKLRLSMMAERENFLRSGAYANSSFAEVERAVYANPEVMEIHMYGLVYAQFLWRDQYERIRFFCDGLPKYRDSIRNYLELGGGHALYISNALEILHANVRFEMVDISQTSMQLARGMSDGNRIEYHLLDLFDFPDGGRFNCIVAGEVLEHLEQPRAMLAKIRELLSPDGVAFITTPVNAPTVDHIYLFNNTDEIRAMVREERFVIESETTCFAEDWPAARCAKLKIPEMWAGFLRVGG